MLDEKTAAELILEAMRHARALSAVLTEANKPGMVIDVEVEKVSIAGRSELIQVMVYPVEI